MPSKLAENTGVRVLLVEDDAVLADGMSAALRGKGHSVHCVADGIHALDALAAERYDVAILDLGLPRMDGIEILQRVRAEDNAIPVLVVTGRHSLADRVGGLRAGADDYLTKPFEFAEFEARVEALARRVRQDEAGVTNTAGVKLDAERRALLFRGRVVELTLREYDIVEILFSNAGTVMSREEIGARLVVGEEELTDNRVQVHISRLRKKLGQGAVRINTARGLGYVLQIDPE